MPRLIFPANIKKNLKNIRLCTIINFGLKRAVAGSAAASSVPASSPIDEKDVIISRLTEDNLRLKGEIDLLKDRVKTINNYLQAAQEGVTH